MQKKESLNEPLAIIGMNCHLPGVSADIEDVEAFYTMLMQGLSPIKEVPKNRWDIEAYYDADRKKVDKIISKKGAFLEHPHLFDAAFFKIAATEAKQMDPQHRLFLEVAIRALNHANIRLDSLSGSDTGVYCGISTHEYSQLNFKDNIEFNAYTSIGSVNSAAVGRLCHFLNLKGPSMAVDTACSSSLSALYLAATALRTQQCPMAIVGGVHFSLCPENFIALSKAHLLSATGLCHSFDMYADGYVRAEGCAVVIVKRLSDAIRDKDTIHALIKNILINQDGGDENTLLVAPNIKSQIALQKKIMQQAEVKPCDIDYIETHGTGTVIGDAVEFNAIKEVHQGQHAQENPLILGALKSTIGHGLAASGIASLIKVVCALKHEVIAPNLNFTKPNKTIEPELIPAVFPIKPQHFLKKKNKKRVAKILNYGFTGVNAAALMEEAPTPTEQATVLESWGRRCFVVSANSMHSLEQMLEHALSYLQETRAKLHDICATLINCRDHYKYRCALLVHDKETLIKKLKSKEYELTKVVLNKEAEAVYEDAEQLHQAYLTGENVSINVPFNKVALPLYFFDRQAYWHEPRTKTNVLEKEPIAIIGMSCRFPKAPNIDAFLSLLQEGHSGMTDIPLDRWDNTKSQIKQLGLIENIKNFDAEFFNVSPREAKYMSPQIRVFLETSYHALEHANLALSAIKDSNTGVFVGCGTNEYSKLISKEGLNSEAFNIHYATGNVLNAIAGRVAYSFDFKGPIQAIDTACSSSMTAIHNACLSLHAYECDMALAGGVNILLVPDSNITLSQANMLSPDSLCKTFSADADGYARSEGCGVLVLKRLSSALKDKDTILAVIKGSAVNSDGHSEGFTVPNGRAQETLIRAALARAKLSPADIDSIEAHGTGTPLADPIEANILMEIFGEAHSQDRPLFLSSVKTNIGHCENAAGVASVIKAVLSLQTHQLFKHLNFNKLNPAIKLKNTLIPLRTLNWQKEGNLRCVGVSSFGFSGANAHLILQEEPLKKKESRTLPLESLLILSAKSQPALALLLVSYQQYLSHTKAEFADICFTAATCREHYSFRVAIKAHSALEAALLIANNEYQIHKGQAKNTVFEFSKGHSLANLQAAYQEGKDIAWGKFYDFLHVDFIKVTLPLYEFCREEYWFDKSIKPKDVSLPEDWCFQVQWQPELIIKNKPIKQGKKWLLMGAQDVAADLISLGLDLVIKEDYFNLDGIIYAKALDTLKTQDIEEQIRIQKHLLKELLSLIKELKQKHIQLQLIVLTTNAVAEFVDEELNLVHAPLVGFCKTLVLELPEYQAILIDLDQESNDYPTRIFDEINYNMAPNYEHLVAYRDKQRWVARLQKNTLIEKKTSLSEVGRYLITGGLGGLGLVSANALLASGAKEVILLARTVDKPAILEAVEKMRQSYPRSVIRTVSLDISNKEKLADLLTNLNADGLLKGIIHAAGAAIKAPLLKHQDEDVDYLFAAKVQGGWYLHEFSLPMNLDFFIAYSSIASVFGSNRESVYSATNSFLDALMARRRQLGLVGSVIQWGPWGEVGMANHRSQIQGLKQALISNEQGDAFVKALLNQPVEQVSLIAPAYLQFMLDFVPKPMPEFHQQLTRTLKKPDASASVGCSDWIHLNLSSIKHRIGVLCKEILEFPKVQELDEDEGFFALGFDSLMLAELSTKLKQQLQPWIQLTVTVGFDYPSINKLSHFIEAELNKATLTSQSLNLESNNEDAIAIIGMSCRLPNAQDLNAFETMLEEGLSGIRDIPLHRWDNRIYFDPDKSYVKQLGLVDHIKGFDAQFFGISPREALLMDPQQRLFLQCCYTAIEHANYPVHALRGSLTGVFAGVGPNEYFSLLLQAGLTHEDFYTITGNSANLIAGRVAYTFDFKGPAISVDTACSSSLVAIHYACQSLKQKEVDYALAGGVNVLLLPEGNINLCKAKVLSPENQCNTFDARANGYVRSEGCGVVLLKRLSDAVRDKDTILAVIKASAVNNDGQTAGLTVPNGKSQEALMRQALKQSHLVSSDISYLEVHGTGTPLGDPIEVHAINQVYGKERGPQNPLVLGAVKTNIGHLESASGVASVIKTVIGLQKQKIYKVLHFKHLNPRIELGSTLLALQKMNWNTHGKLKNAAVNAFGFSGTNAHVILQEFPKATQSQAPYAEQVHLLVLSAKTQSALNQLIKLYQEYLASTNEEFADVCFTASTCREHYSRRVAVAAKNTLEASNLLQKGEFAQDHALLQAYLQGEKIDWNLYYQSMQLAFKKVNLPTYPFDLTEFWLTEKKDLAPTAPPVTQKSEGSFLDSLLQHTEKESIALLSQTLKEITAQVLALEQTQPIDDHSGLYALGLDSLLAIEIRNRIYDKLACPMLNLSLEYFINEPTIAHIAQNIVKELTALFEFKKITFLQKEETVEKAPLCDFQYPFWVVHKLNYAYNLGTRLQIKGPLNQLYVEQAFDLIVKQHSAFWLYFDKKVPMQRINRQGKFVLDFEDLSSRNHKVLDHDFYDNMMRAIPLSQQPLIRVYLYQINPDLHELHIIIPHIIVEGSSCDLIWRQFKKYYAMLRLGQKIIEEPEQESFLNFVIKNNQHYGSNLANKIDFWTRYNRGFKLLRLRSEYYDINSYNHNQHLYHYPIDSSAMEQWIQWHKAQNINVSTGLIAATHLAFYPLSKQKKIPVQIMHSGREGSLFKEVVGMFSEYKKINLSFNEEDQFIDYLRSIEQQLLITAPYQKCSQLIKNNQTNKAALTLGQRLYSILQQLVLKKDFSKSNLSSQVLNYYLDYFSWTQASNIYFLSKYKLNQLVKWKISLQKPEPLRVLINITPSFFDKTQGNKEFANLKYQYANHFGSEDRPTGSNILWVLFSKNQQGEHVFSINGPLSVEAKDLIAKNFMEVVENLVKNGGQFRCDNIL